MEKAHPELHRGDLGRPLGASHKANAAPIILFPSPNFDSQ